MSKRVSPDPLSLIPRIVSKFYTLWLVWTYPFASVGKDFWAHYTLDLRRLVAPYVKIGKGVGLDQDVWLNIPFVPTSPEPVIVLEDGVRIGRRCMISAKNRVEIGQNVIFGPSVLITDHLHAFEDVSVPIVFQGITEGGTVRVEEGCWLGFGAAVVCNHGELVIGKNSVVGANSVVTRSVPPGSVVVGNPARIVKRFDPTRGEWVLGGATGLAESLKQSAKV
jgi:acetyltransferase-like isoleucine patch superfamily enzyme